MIIFGVKVTESATETGTFPCPNCRTPQHYRRLTMRRWFSLYFIPVIPMGRIGEQVECQGCFSRFAAQVLWADQQSMPQPGDPHSEQASPTGPHSQQAPRPGEPNSPDPQTGHPQTGYPQTGYPQTGYPQPGQTPQPVHNPFTAQGAPASGPAQPHPAYNPFVAEPAGAAPGSPYGPAAPIAVTSSLAITSLILALLSPFLLLACGMSIFSSAAAVITGHAAIRRIGKSKGTMDGRGIALGGVIAGYVFLTLSVLLLGVFFVPAFLEGWNGSPAGRSRRVASRPAPSQTSTPSRSTTPSPRTLPSIPKSPTFDPPSFEPRPFETPPLAPQMADAIPSTPVSADTIGTSPSTTSNSRNGDTPTPPDVSPFVPFEGLDEIPGGSPPIESPPGRSPPTNPFQPSNPFQPIDADDAFADAQKRAEESRQQMEDMIAKSRADLDRLRQSTSGFAPPPFPRAPIAGRNFGQRPNVAEPPKQPQPVVPQKPANVVQSFPDLGATVQSIAFSPNGERIAIGKIDRTLSTLDVKSGKVLAVSKDVASLGSVDHVSFSEDGQQIVAGGARGAITVVPVLSGGQLGKPQLRKPHQRSVESLTISPGGKFVISGSRGDVMWQALSGDQSRKLDALERKVMAIFLPKVGLAALATDGATLVEIVLSEGRVTRSVSLGSQLAHAAAFSSDGKRLVLSRGKKLVVIDTASGDVAREIETDQTINWTVAFSPDGSRIASGGRGEVEIWNTETGSPVTEFSLGGVLYVQSLAISPDGTMLAAIPSSSGQTLQVFRLPAED
ncbi:MAG: DUF4190 domain-containing protein [Rubripirellula sp.]